MPDRPTPPTAQSSTDQPRDFTSTHNSETMTEDARSPETMTENARPTETDSPTTDGIEDARPPTKPTLGDINHTNPYTNRTFGDTQTYDRGRLVAADGGRAAPDGGEDRDADRRPDDETLEDVDHTPDDDVDGAQGSFDRGEEAGDGEPDDE